MPTFRKRVEALNECLTQGATLKAMELFYAEEVTMQENEEEPRRGKQFCMTHERKNLERVKDFKLVILNQAIDETKQIVFTEMEIHFTTKNGQRMKMVEVAVQHWTNGWVTQEKFYYKDMIQMPPHP